MAEQSPTEQNEAVYLETPRRVSYSRQSSVQQQERPKLQRFNFSYDSNNSECEPRSPPSPSPSMFLEVPNLDGYGRGNSFNSSQEQLFDDPNQITMRLPTIAINGQPAKLTATRRGLERLRQNFGIVILLFGFLLLIIGIIVFLVRASRYTTTGIQYVLVSPVIGGTTTTVLPTTVRSINPVYVTETSISSIFMGLGALFIFIGLSIIFGPRVKAPKPLTPRSARPFPLGRRVSSVPDTDFYQRSLSISSEVPGEVNTYNPQF